MIDEKKRERLECDIGLLASKYSDVDLEDVIEIIRLCWSFESDIVEHVLRGNIQRTG